MEEYVLQEVKIYTKTAHNDALKLAKNLQRDGIKTSILKDKPSKQEILKEKLMKKEGGNGILYLTDCDKVAIELTASGLPVCGCLTKENSQNSFMGLRYLTQGMADIDREYLEYVYRRLHQLPLWILETSRCKVRETTIEDVDVFYQIYAEPSVTRYMENLFAQREEEIIYTIQYRENMYEFYDFGIWTIILKESNEVIGRAGFTMREGFEEPELGFLIGVPWQRQGLAKEVCEAILDYGRREHDFLQVQALTEPENIASIKLLEGLGFVFQDEYIESKIKYFRYLKSYSS